MPFDPNLPVDNSPMAAPEMRAQLNGLKDLIDTLTTQVGDLQTELSLVPPGAAEIIDIYANDIGTLHIEITSSRATHIRVWRQGPGDPGFVEETVPSLIWDAVGLESGTHTVKAAGVSAGGIAGPPSAEQSVLVI